MYIMLTLSWPHHTTDLQFGSVCPRYVCIQGNTFWWQHIQRSRDLPVASSAVSWGPPHSQIPNQSSARFLEYLWCGKHTSRPMMRRPLDDVWAGHGLPAPAPGSWHVLWTPRTCCQPGRPPLVRQLRRPRTSGQGSIQYYTKMIADSLMFIYI